MTVPTGIAEAAGKGGKGSGARSTTTYYTYPDAPILAISPDGNIVRFEGPGGYEHLAIGAYSDGYVLCYGTKVAYDVGDLQAGFGTSTASCSGNRCTVTRRTSDNVLELKQVITKDIPTERSFDVQMTVRNLSAASISRVILRRQTDLDVDTGGRLGTAGFINWFGSTERDSVFAWNPTSATSGEGHGVFMVSRTPRATGYRTTPKVTNDILDTSCSPTNIAASNPIRGDFGATIETDLSPLARGASKTATVEFQRN